MLQLLTLCFVLLLCSYIVPELNNDSQPRPDWCSFIDRVSRCQKAIGTDKTVPLIAVGPISLVFLSKGNFNRSEMITRLVPAYTALLAQLKDLNGGVKEVQVSYILVTCIVMDVLAFFFYDGCVAF